MSGVLACACAPVGEIIAAPVSLQWLAEVNKYARDAPRVLVGLQCDLRTAARQQECVLFREAERFARENRFAG